MITTDAEYVSEKSKLCILLFVVLAFSILECSTLRLTNMTAPVVQDPRQEMPLYCEFDMGGEELYAVKWYKDDHEFFRYSPSGSQRLLQFQVIGVHVDLSRTKCTTTSCSLVLNELSRTFSSGAYRCEVSTEAPTFRLASQTHNITVAVIPQNSPTIEGLNNRYLVGDLVVATCSSALGDPKPIITWYINKQPVNKKSLRELTQSPPGFYDDGERVKLKSTTVQLRFPLDKNITDNKPSTSLEVACVQTSDSFSTALSPPRSTSKIVRVATEEQLVDNQKLYGIFSSEASIFQGSVVSVMLAIVLNY